MEHPKDPYHVRPFPQQPHHGNKDLQAALLELESTIGDTLPDLERLKMIQARIHTETNKCNDDKLVDMIRVLSEDLDLYFEKPKSSDLQKILKQILKVRVELKHL